MRKQSDATALRILKARHSRLMMELANVKNQRDRCCEIVDCAKEEARLWEKRFDKLLERTPIDKEAQS